MPAKILENIECDSIVAVWLKLVLGNVYPIICLLSLKYFPGNSQCTSSVKRKSRIIYTNAF